MTGDRNPQAEQMADESMVRNLAAQAEATWPQERELIRAYALPEEARILDVACGTGEMTARLAAEFPRATFVGVDVHSDHLHLARERCAAFGDRVRFQEDDAFALAQPEGSFDLLLCRHLVQAVPHPERIARELARVTRSGGRVHVVAEDYGMMHFHPTQMDTDRFWHDGPIAFARKTGTDLLIGRKMPGILRAAGLTDVRLDYVVVDTVRVPREVFAEIWRAWRDGYAEAIASETRFSASEVRTAFDEMIAAILDPNGYAVWHLPVVSGVAP